MFKYLYTFQILLLYLSDLFISTRSILLLQFLNFKKAHCHFGNLNIDFTVSSHYIFFCWKDIDITQKN
jgi:hypothetical protein